MEDKRASLEKIAPTIEEAIEKGLEELGLTEDEVEIEILDSGSKGLFGLGSRQARVKLTVGKGLESEEEERAGQPVPVPMPMPMPMPIGEAVAPKKPVEAIDRTGESEEDAMLRVARDTMVDLLQKMKVRAKVSVHFKEPEDALSKAAIWVDVHGDDLSILIGPKSETLNALQYIASLIISKQIGHTVPVSVDIQGFRARREQQLRQLARRMAEQAKKTGRRQILEPMPASERRLVHLELRSDPDVTTESIGEEPRRKVTILPKEQG